MWIFVILCPWNIHIYAFTYIGMHARTRTAQFIRLFNPAAANTLFPKSQEKTRHIFSWPENVSEKPRVGDIKEAEYRSLAIHHVRMLSYGHKWLIMTPQRTKTQECHHRMKSRASKQELLNWCVPDIVSLCCRGTICQSKYLFKSKMHSLSTYLSQLKTIELFI